jgi:hypothetical protein
MILAISGKSQSGKDTVGKIIQYLTHCRNDKTTWEEWQLLQNTKMCDWKIKKFADKLKDIVCLLIGCTREQLEDETFKNTELGPEWIQCFNSDYDLIEEKDYDEEIGHFSEYLTPRKLLQLIGTECGRNIIHPNIWVNALMGEYEPIWKHSRLKITIPYDKEDIDVDYPNWVITDVRFPNEADAIKQRDGIIIRVNKNKEQLLRDKGIHIPKHLLTPEHESETALDNAEFDYVIDNNGTIEKLIEQVKYILVKEKII